MVATAIVGTAIVGGVMQRNSTKSAANTAAQAQTQASDQAIAEQRRQFDKLQQLLQPYVQAGTGALGQQQALIGLSGQQQQQDAITALQNSPEYQAMTQQGENAILQNASATGGLRGGNVQRSLAQFRPALLSQLINQQYQRLGGLTQMGQASAAGVGSAGQQTAGAIGQYLQNSGDATAQSALATGKANANMWGDIAGGVGTFLGSF